MRHKNKLILITGGVRSGKSRLAVEIAAPYQRRAFIATAREVDTEMAERIKKHKEERKENFDTFEVPVYITKLADKLKEYDVAVLDCMTVWLGNLYYEFKDRREIDNEIESLLVFLKDPPCTFIVVTNEVGWGIIPENEIARDFRDRLGMVNCNIAKLSDCVVLTICGITTFLKCYSYIDREPAICILKEKISRNFAWCSFNDRS